MKILKTAILVIVFPLLAQSCGPSNTNTNTNTGTGRSTPIDSTNVKGTAPATYGADDPANDHKDSNRSNLNDTGARANTVHRQGNLPEERLTK